MVDKEVLSEGELEALMGSVSDEAAAGQNAAATRHCASFDFSTREQTLLVQMPVLKTLTEKQAMSFAQGLQSLFKAPVEVQVADIRPMKQEEALLSMPELAGITQIKTAPLNGTSMVVVSGDALSFFVNQYFGGWAGGGGHKSNRTNLTPTERRINDLVVGRFLSALTEGWQEKISLSGEVCGFETNPDFIQPLAAGELLLKFPFVIKLFDWEGIIDWFIPYAAIEPLKNRLGNPAAGQTSKTDVPGWEAFFRRELLSVELEVSGVFTSKNMSLSDVMRLRKGVVIPLAAPTAVTLCIEGAPFCVGEHGAMSGRKSIKIKQVLKHDS
ncbi:MAG: hypothetical protein COA29_02310 [Porticoccus sp.]|nr:MAG: hypothetical protein COA29_02310 [Porticoccus sp.]